MLWERAGLNGRCADGISMRHGVGACVKMSLSGNEVALTCGTDTDIGFDDDCG